MIGSDKGYDHTGCDIDDPGYMGSTSNGLSTQLFSRWIDEAVPTILDDRPNWLLRHLLRAF